MFLIREEIEDTQYLTEGTGADKKMYIQGPFLSGARANRNKRIYPLNVLQPEAERYIREEIQTGSGWGELSHPESPVINPDRISHRTVSLTLEGTDYIGKALVIKENPCGALVAGLINSGGRVGVSSRGLGSLRPNSAGLMEVQSDYRIATCADVVLNPSGINCFVNGLLEGVQFAVTDDGRYVQEEAKKAIRQMSLNEISDRKEAIFKSFILQLTK